MSHSQKKRKEIYKRDGNKCLKCGCKIRYKLTLDHIIPKSWGGHNGKKNLQTLCKDCNEEKGARIIDYRKNAKRKVRGVVQVLQELQEKSNGDKERE